MSKDVKPIMVPAEIQVPYNYSVGIAGSKFLAELRDNGKFMATKCKKCGYVMMPPRIFCEECFIDDVEWVEASSKGVIQTFAVSYMSPEGKRIKDPWMLAIVKLDKSDGGLVVRLDEVKPDDVKIGMKVEAVLKPKYQRVGSILDIQYFRPIKD
jgi:hypothetical protein